MKISIKLAVMVRVDNVVAIFMATNITMSHTKPLDIRYKYMNGYVEDGVVKIVFVSLLAMAAIFSPRT